MAGMAAVDWRALKASVLGASHKRSGKPNQDAVAIYPEQRFGLPLIAAVADGHGGADYVRSDRGAKLAVTAAVDVLSTFSRDRSAGKDGSEIKALAEAMVPAAIERRWRTLVEADREADPFPGEGNGRGNAHQSRYLAYGTTLLAVLVDSRFILFLQLGDGDILTVDADGSVSRPIPSDPELVGNETTSLCQDDARRHVRLCFQRLAGAPPALILLSTDGYAKSFGSDDDFRKVGSDFLELIRKDGLESVERALEGWLNEVSEQGSGDDVSLDLIVNLGLVRPAPAAPTPDTSQADDLPPDLPPEDVTPAAKPIEPRREAPPAVFIAPSRSSPEPARRSMPFWLAGILAATAIATVSAGVFIYSALSPKQAVRQDGSREPEKTVETIVPALPDDGRQAPAKPDPGLPSAPRDPPAGSEQHRETPSGPDASDWRSPPPRADRKPPARSTNGTPTVNPHQGKEKSE